MNEAQTLRPADLYRRLWDSSQAGPQIEGIAQDEAEEALNDMATITAPWGLSQVPAFVPMVYAGWYNPEFIAAVQADARLYFASPPQVGLDAAELRKRILEDYAGQTVAIFYDRLSSSFRRDDLETFLVEAGLSFEIIQLGSSGDAEASLTQFSGPVRMKDRTGMKPPEEQGFRRAVSISQSDSHLNRERSARTLSKPVNDVDFDQIWDFYPESFRRASEGHPLVQSFDREELRAMLDSPSSVVAVSTSDGVIVSLAFLSSAGSCPWLNLSYYNQKHPVELSTGNIVHMPTVVTNESYRGQDQTTHVFNELVSCLAESGNDIIFLGECNDFTVDIIPVLADSFFASKESRMSLDWQPIAVYKYGALRLTVPTKPE